MLTALFKISLEYTEKYMDSFFEGTLMQIWKSANMFVFT